MNLNNHKGLTKVSIGLLILFAVCFVIGMLMFNGLLSSRLSDMEKNSEVVGLKPAAKKAAVPEKVTEANIKKTSRGVTCTIRLDPGRTFYRYVFFQDGEEIARMSLNLDGEVIEKEGTIPNGKIEFSDLTKDTHGFQYYDNGKKDGDFREYSAADVLLKEAQYWNGTLVSNREYYEDGVLKKEENYEDARDQKIEGLTGRGKFYSPDGGLKFEWRYLRNEKVGYNKSYNRNGRLTKEVYYDENGQPVSSPAAPGAAAGNP